MEGDKNTKYFHSYVKGRRKRLYITEIENNQGVKFFSNKDISDAVVQFFQEQFKSEEISGNYSMIDHIPRMINEDQNEEVIKIPNQEEVKKIVFELNGSSACGPDDFTGLFFQYCWDIVGEDVTKIVQVFFCGQELPKYITHTNLVLIPKKEIVKNFSDLRPIA